MLTPETRNAHAMDNDGNFFLLAVLLVPHLFVLHIVSPRLKCVRESKVKVLKVRKSFERCIFSRKPQKVIAVLTKTAENVLVEISPVTSMFSVLRRTRAIYGFFILTSTRTGVFQ